MKFKKGDLVYFFGNCCLAKERLFKIYAVRRSSYGIYLFYVGGYGLFSENNLLLIKREDEI